MLSIIGMDRDRHSGERACWALLWRSLIYVPWLFFIFVGVGGVWLSRWLLPLYIVLAVFARLWWFGGVALVLWLAAMWGYRRFRLVRFFEPPSSLL